MRHKCICIILMFYLTPNTETAKSKSSRTKAPPKDLKNDIGFMQPINLDDTAKINMTRMLAPFLRKRKGARHRLSNNPSKNNGDKLRHRFAQADRSQEEFLTGKEEEHVRSEIEEKEQEKKKDDIKEERVKETVNFNERIKDNINRNTDNRNTDNRNTDNRNTDNRNTDNRNTDNRNRNSDDSNQDDDTDSDSDEYDDTPVMRNGKVPEEDLIYDLDDDLRISL